MLRGENGSAVRVGDVARVDKAFLDPPEQIAMTAGERTVLVAAQMGRGQRVTSWSVAAADAVEEYRQQVGGGVGLDVVFDQGGYTRERLGELVGNLLLGAGVVVVVVFLIMGWRSALVVGATLPLVSAGVLFATLLVGRELHQMSIFGMIIALGLLIDNGIVVTDEVAQHLGRGESRLDAVGNVVRKYFAPLLASTLTTVLAFAPIALLPGSGGDFISGIAISVILAIFLSFAVAMTIIVTLAGRFLSVGNTTSYRGVLGFLRHGLHVPTAARAYQAFLRGVVAVPIVACLAALSIPASGFVVASSMGSSFFPPTSRDMFDIQVWLPESAAIGQTHALVGDIEQVALSVDGIEQVDWLVGASYPSVYYNLIMNQDGSPQYARGVVHTTDATTTDAVVGPLQKLLSDRFPQARIIVNRFGQGPPVTADIEYRIFGDDLPTLRRLGEEMRLALQTHPDVVQTNATIAAGTPKVFFEADEDEARLGDLSLTGLGGQLAANLSGVTGGSVLEGLEELPVRVRHDGQGQTTFARLASTNFPTAAGSFVPLESIGTISLQPTEPGITHYDGRRVNTIEAYTRDGALAIDVGKEVLDELRAGGFELPPGYALGLGGEAEQSGDSQGNLATYAPAIVLAMIATLILTFRSVRMAVLLLVIAVCCAGLGILSTWAIGLPQGFNMILGILGLIGIALNDSIVVISSIRSNVDARDGDREAIVQEVVGCTRHVMATTFTTVGGFAPLLLLAEGDFWPSLAIVLAGGILGATVLALVLIPAAYVLVHPRKFQLFRLTPA